MHYVTDAAYVTAHKLKVRLENGEVRVVDSAPHWDGPIFQPLKDPAYFKSFTVNQDIDTVTWPNDADFSPDFLYEIGQPIGQRTA